MGKKTEEELNQILENVKKITESAAKTVPTQEELESIRQSYAGVVPDAQNTADLIGAYAHLTPQQSATVTQASVRIIRTAGEGESAQTEVYPITPSQENIDQIMEAVNRLVPPQDLQKMTEAAERMKNGSGDMAQIFQGLFSIAQASGSMKTNPAATQELLALQQVLTQKKQMPREEGAAGERAERTSVWRTVYIVLGVVIAAGLILTLAVPGFKEAVLGWLS